VQEAQTRELPVSFSSFVVSLASSAMVHLGEAPDPQTRRRAVDLALARNTIDLLSLLHDKTKGNLEEDESKLLEALLYELRLKFVNASKSS
jgi:hypothetical protein